MSLADVEEALDIEQHGQVRGEYLFAEYAEQPEALALPGVFAEVLRADIGAFEAEAEVLFLLVHGGRP